MSTESLCNRVLVVIPAYNHGATLRSVVKGVLNRHPHVLVVNDGSVDIGPHLLDGLDVRMVSHSENRGKGAAIRTGAQEASRFGMTHIITIDADGQHDPEDIPRFLEAIAEDELSIVVGARDFNTANVPGSSRFGRKFSNFWLRVQTGIVLSDVQSGFRAYPLFVFTDLNFTEDRYSFEVEVLVRAAWAGITLRDLDIRVYYPPAEQRISHFHAIKDNVRISMLNTRLTIRAIAPLPHKKLGQDGQGRVSPMHPIRSLRFLLQHEATPRCLALSCALGILIGTVPIVGLQNIAILLLTGIYRLNKFAALAASQLCMPPVIPACCIELGYLLRHGSFLTTVSFQTLGHEGLQRIWEWLLGSLMLAPVLSVLVGGAVYVMARIVSFGLNRNQQSTDPA